MENAIMGHLCPCVPELLVRLEGLQKLEVVPPEKVLHHQQVMIDMKLEMQQIQPKHDPSVRLNFIKQYARNVAMMEKAATANS